MTHTESLPRDPRQATDLAAFSILLLVWEGIILVILSVWAKYPEGEDGLTDNAYWYQTRDVSIMVFFGFGFLMTYLRRYGFSAICYSFVIAAIVCQWSIIWQLFFEELSHHDAKFDGRRDVGVFHFLHGLFCSAAVLISYGAVLGKINPTQIVVLAFFEPFFFWVNFYVSFLTLKALDIGGGIFLHEFGAYYGLAVTFFVTSKRSKGHPDNVSCYSSDIFSLAGTLFLFIMWPSFNAVTAVPGTPQVRALTNTFLSLCGAVISASVVSRLFSGGKFEMAHMQNSTLAGGVMMGTAGDLNVSVAGAIASGLVAGAISVLGYRYLTPFLSRRLGIQDICGVHNLHGMPGVLGGIISIFVTTGVSQDHPEEFPRGENQGGYQTAALFITFGIAVGGGLFTGFIIWLMDFWAPIGKDDLYNDRAYWQLPSDYEWVVDTDENAVEMEDVEAGADGEKKKRKRNNTFLRPQGRDQLKPRYNRTGSLLDLNAQNGNFAKHDARPPAAPVHVEAEQNDASSSSSESS
eukprot:TRINITY_DN997_c0_g1_i1.p1 TRINITY_DN997_c0_g1~~TRINITY_DN997_c0_g1_i1.p1  ORF type:complete len:555 (-),score=82.71 TRINITY_DN997_c0_g1_i1:160-1716(-)